MLVTTDEVIALTQLKVGDTDLINTLIAPVQSDIEAYCERLFDAQDYAEWFPWSSEVMVDNYPVNEVKFVGSRQSAATFTDTSDTEDLYNYEVVASKITGLQSSLNITDANVSSTSFSFSTYSNLNDLKTIVEATLPDITMTITEGFDNTNYRLFKEGGGRTLYAASRSDGFAQVLDNRTINISGYRNYSYDTAYYGSAFSLFIIYNAGYSTVNVPQGLKLITSNVIQDIVNTINSNLSGLLSSENLTNYSYKVADPDQINQALKKYHVALDHYRTKIL